MTPLAPGARFVSEINGDTYTVMRIGDKVTLKNERTGNTYTTTALNLGNERLYRRLP